ncbi:hypothetical protein B0H16DRAFT_1456596 [Mycena metata]|uniref:Uncharacterized protein n=1 Tax=Mycena metata TaxID=1033252 RepID=A0AAD7J8Z1_9AGAR|nr:hypothetical protein B0H16DRAFT_1456596 [Mycena metata]
MFEKVMFCPANNTSSFESSYIGTVKWTNLGYQYRTWSTGLEFLFDSGESAAPVPPLTPFAARGRQWGGSRGGSRGGKGASLWGRQNTCWGRHIHSEGAAGGVTGAPLGAAGGRQRGRQGASTGAARAAMVLGAAIFPRDKGVNVSHQGRQPLTRGVNGVKFLVVR